MPIASETRVRTISRLLLCGWMALIFALSSRSQLPHLADVPSEFIAVAGHFIVYAVLAALLWAVLPSRGWPMRRRLAVVFAIAMTYALSDEWHQSFVAGRSPALSDLVVDAVGILCALFVVRLAVRTYGDSTRWQLPTRFS